jgi:hypothetical protein
VRSTTAGIGAATLSDTSALATSAAQDPGRGFGSLPIPRPRSRACHLSEGTGGKWPAFVTPSRRSFPGRGRPPVARPSRPWFRLYVEIVSDPKVRRLSPDHRWLWVALLAAARMSPLPGALLVAEHEPYDERDLADFAGLPQRVVSAGLGLFERLGLIERGDEGVWEIPSWAERQYESDTSTERTAKKREKDRSKNGETPFPETEESAFASVSVFASLSSQQKTAAFERFYEIYPRHVGKGAAQKAFLSAAKRAPVATILAAATRFASDPNLPEREFVAYPTTWLNQDRWEDEPLPARLSANGKHPPTRPRATACSRCGGSLKDGSVGNPPRCLREECRYVDA